MHLGKISMLFILILFVLKSDLRSLYKSSILSPTRTDDSTSISKCEPPLKSNPRFTCLDGKKLGNLSTCEFDRKLGSEKNKPNKQKNNMDNTLNFEKYNITKSRLYKDYFFKSDIIPFMTLTFTSSDI